MRSVLVVTFCFPPWGLGGAVRVAKMVKYLPQAGWRPVVLTARSEYYDPPLDETLLAEIPAGTVVERTAAFLPKRKALPEGGAPVTPPPALLRWAVRLLAVPDLQLAWIPALLKHGEALARREGCEAVMAVGPPHSVLLGGALLARRLDLPLVLDLKDPWVGNAGLSPPGPRRWVEPLLERWVMGRSSHVTTATDIHRRDLLERHPCLFRSRVSWLANGFDPEDFAGPTPASSGALVHGGYLGWGRDVTPFLEGLEDFLNARPQERPKTRVRFLGPVPAPLAEAVRRLGLEDVVSLAGTVSRSQYLAEIRAARALLLFPTTRIPDAVPGKLYEYLAARRPILAVGAPNPVRGLLNMYGASRCADSPAEVAGALGWLRSENGAFAGPVGHPDVLDMFNRRQGAVKLGQILESLEKVEAA